MVKIWKDGCVEIFLVDGIPKEAKVRIASIHLERWKALQWHQSYFKNHKELDLNMNWEDYLRPFNTRFGETVDDDPLLDQINLK